MSKTLAFAAILSLVAAPALAQNCPPLKQLAAIKLEKDAGSHFLVPVTVSGTAKKMTLDTGASMSQVWPSTVEAMKLPVRQAQNATDYRSMMITGPELQGVMPMVSEAAPSGFLDRNEQLAYLDGFAIGTLNAGQGYFLVRSGAVPAGLAADVAGSVGMDLLARVDFDLVLSENALNLFSTEHCDQQVIYWESGAVVAAPFTFDTKNRIRVPVTVDGVKLSAVLDTDSPEDRVNLDVAQGKLKFNESAQGVEALTADPVSGAKKYNARFTTINLGGIQFQNRQAVVMEDKNKNVRSATTLIGSTVRANAEDARDPDFTIGQAMLSRLHVYVATREKKLYISPMP